MNCPSCKTPLASEARFCPACGYALAVTSSATDLPVQARDLVGRDVGGNYRILAKLGEGGMGAVYRGEQRSLKRPVAVKVLRPELSSNEMLLRRFQAEAQVIARLSHPNTVNIYDFGQDGDGSLYIAMEFIEGRSLRSVVQREAPLPPPRALHIARQIAASLADAHAHAIVHRDLKPDNVMLQERGRDHDVVRVLDFGIAKLRDEGRQTQQAMTQAGDMLGTPQYMAPEQIRGDAVDGRADIYALGCMIYEMLTGRMAFEAPTVMAMLSKHLVEAPAPPSQRRPDLGISPALDRLVLMAMQKDPRARPPTMELYGEEIAAALGSVAAQSPSVPYRPEARSPTPVPPSMYGDPNAALAAPTPGGYPSPVPPGALPGPPGYGAPGSGVPGVAAQGTPAPLGMAYARPPGRSRVWLYATIAAVGLGAIAVAGWQLTRHANGGTSSDAPADAGAPGPDPWGDHAAKPDPWGGGATPTPPPPPTSPPDAAPAPAVPRPVYALPLPAGVHVDTPTGFVRDDQKIAEVVIDRKHQLFVSADAVGPGSADVPSIAAAFATRLGLHYDGSIRVTSKGEQRDVILMSGTMPSYGPINVLSVLYQVSPAVVVVSVGVKPEMYAKPGFRDWALALIEQNLNLP